MARLRDRALQGLLEPAVDLDRVDVGHLRREVGGQHPEPGADLEHDVLRPQVGQAVDDPQDVVVEQEVLAEVAVGLQPQLAEPGEGQLARRPVAHRPNANARAALATTCSPSAPASSPRRPATKRSVSST